MSAAKYVKSIGLCLFVLLCSPAFVSGMGCCSSQQTCQVKTENASEGNRWFKSEQPAKYLVKTVDLSKLGQQPGPEGTKWTNIMGPEHMLAQSISGLCSLAVNEGRFDEVLWINYITQDYKIWYQGAIKRLGLQERGEFGVWELVERYKDKGIFDGYILYRYDRSGQAWEEREGIDQSVNVATSLAPLMKGLLIEETQEEKAKSYGLKKLIDVRGKDVKWCFDNYRHKLNRDMLLTIDPQAPQNRAYAISQKCAATFDVKEGTEMFCKWLNPPAPVLGWNCGDEMEQTAIVTEYGHFQTATNWAYNLAILSSGTQEYKGTKFKNLNPNDIDWNDKRHPVSYLMSDGDNIQWLMGNFCFHDSYWTNQYNGDFAMGWTACPSHLVQVCPETVDYLARTKPDNATIIEYGAGYYYPDLYADKRSNRAELLKIRAKNISAQMAKHGANVFGFICKDVDSDQAMEAYKIFAEGIDGLLGMIAFQYYPYNGGNGDVYWVKNKNGQEIPVITATLTIWSNARWDGGGTPAKMARMINEAASKETGPGYDLVAVHAWSEFKKSDSNDDMAENIARDATDQEKKLGQRGLTPIKWSVDRIDKTRAMVVSPEELIWRIRMMQKPQATKEIIKNYK